MIHKRINIKRITSEKYNDYNLKISTHLRKIPLFKRAVIPLIFILSLSSCVGDRLEFRNKGTVYLEGNRLICIKSTPGDILTYYLLSSSENNYAPPLAVAVDIKRAYPDTCINSVTLKENVAYDLNYILNDIKYKAEFSVDKSSTIKGVK
ncbi:putative T6SS immunity periplasmic lipoprotein [Chimaeribacter californicus]|uniref:putative T6SS immunity periplasmic lipoprotein n=1 Tax=Chimaeribacter californicus TaxID=2060067 RepID=UPI0011AF1D3E|nr:putative T6SS immunity periplasmic lipoprotein [Chimaeribacter californicus]